MAGELEATVSCDQSKNYPEKMKTCTKAMRATCRGKP